MRKIIAGMLAVGLAITASLCQTGSCRTSGAELPKTGTEETGDSQKLQVERGFKAEIGKEIGPLFSEKVDVSKQGVPMSGGLEFATEMAKGDDGACYYYRNEGKGKNKKIVFYKNNGIKICETKMKKSFQKKGYYISAFVKYGDYFFLLLDSGKVTKCFFTTIKIKNGKWGKVIKTSEYFSYPNIIVYENRFYCENRRERIVTYDLSGKREKIKLPGFRVTLQCIVDGKIYYRFISNRKKSGEDTEKIMRCSLDGSDRECLFQYKVKKDGIGMDYTEGLRIDGDYIYFLMCESKEDSTWLKRVPLYGGVIQGVAAASTWFELSDDMIFFDNGDYEDNAYYICKVDKNLSEEPEIVTECHYNAFGLDSIGAYPFRYADGHLMVHGYNGKEYNTKDELLHFASVTHSWSLYAKLMSSYAPDWYWVSEDGEVEDIIKGSGVKNSWRVSGAELPETGTEETGDSQEVKLERGFKAEIGKEIGPLFSEKVDASKQGVPMSGGLEFATEMAKGDDGACYYYRNEGKGKNKKIVFYKNNGIKICETKMKKSFQKKRYYISAFVKYGDCFFLLLDSGKYMKSILTTIKIENGEWGKVIKTSDYCCNIIVYENRFYCQDISERIITYDLSGERTETELPGYEVVMQCIVDGKIYYRIVGNRKKSGETTEKIMRCSLDGSDRECLFQYKVQKDVIGMKHTEALRIDGDYLYFLVCESEEDSTRLKRVPLHGGVIQGVADASTWFELSDDMIFFDNGDYEDDAYYICKVDKNLSGEPEIVTECHYNAFGLYSIWAYPFRYADGHLMVHGYNKEEYETIDDMIDFASVTHSWSLYAKLISEYAPDWYWVTENGKVEDVIKGSGVKESWE